MVRAAFLALLLAAAAPAIAQGAKSSASFDTKVSQLKPGQFVWDERVAPDGPMVVVVNLASQRAYVYRNGIRIGASTISSGKKGHSTPTGVFTILQKNKDHVSNIYKGAKMPYMQRLTWDGIALHAGQLPGYAASHGCIRLPYEFSKRLFAETKTGMTVVVVDKPAVPEEVADSLVLAPVTPKGKADIGLDRTLSEADAWRWTPEKSASGPVSIIISTDDRRMVVIRNGVEIGRSRIGVKSGFDIGTRVLLFEGRDENGQGKWTYIGLPGYEARKGQAVEVEALQSVQIPPEFVEKLRSVIVPGTMLMATDGGLVEGHTGKELRILTNG